jgi:hypothetical protein
VAAVLPAAEAHFPRTVVTNNQFFGPHCSGDGGCARPRVARLWKIAVSVLLVTLLAAGGLYYRSHHQGNYLTGKDTIVLADLPTAR